MGSDVSGTIQAGFSGPPTAGDIVYFDNLSVKQITNAALTTSVAQMQIPQADDVFSFGEITKVAKEFRITNISRSQQMIRRVQALEYHWEVYDDAATIPDLPNPPTQ